jgi:hypothetical protein
MENMAEHRSAGRIIGILRKPIRSEALREVLDRILPPPPVEAAIRAARG